MRKREEAEWGGGVWGESDERNIQKMQSEGKIRNT